MRFIFKSCLFIAIAAYFIPASSDKQAVTDSFLNEAGGAISSIFTSFMQDNTVRNAPRAGIGNTLNQDDLMPAWQGPTTKRRG